MKGLLAILFVFIALFAVSKSLASIDQIALSDFYNTLTPASQSILSWDLGNLCSEPEIICISNRVTSLVITKTLTGSIPASFSNLTSVSTLIINSQFIIGSVPDLSQMTQLKFLDLSHNQLTGSLPSQFPISPLLTQLNLANNNLDGTIPTQIGGLYQLNSLDLSNNQISGSIPSSFQGLLGILDINLSNNQLTGTVPTIMSKLSTLLSIRLNHNMISGIIPYTLRNMNLQEAYFDENFTNCPYYFYSGTIGDDSANAENRCNTICPGSCTESCAIGGTNYDTAVCLPTQVCAQEISLESGIAGDDIFIFGGDFFPGTIVCTFGAKTVEGFFFTSNIIDCKVPTGNPIGTVNVLVTIDGIGQTCGLTFHYNSGSGTMDPHFRGFHGEATEINRDDQASNQLFHLFCSPSITITTLFYKYPEDSLFMTKFWVRLGGTLFTLSLSTYPIILTSHDVIYYLPDLGRYRIDIEDGHLEWDDSMLRVSYKQLQINFSNKIYLDGSPYMNVDVIFKDVPTEPATGIIGRTVKNKLSKQQFDQYLQFKASVEDIVTFTCPRLTYSTI